MEKQKTNNNSNTQSSLSLIKSSFILKKIFNNLSQRNHLAIVKNNKYFQSRLNITINDFKKFCIIEVELTLIKGQNEYERDNKEKKDKYHFINIEKNKKPYFHIIFDKNDNRKINIKIDNEVKSLKELFYFCNDIESIKFIKFNIPNITDMSFMFSN